MIHSSPLIRAYVRPRPGRGADAQQIAARMISTNVVVYGADERATWLRSLGPGQTGWVWRLSWLAVDHGGPVRPIADYAVCIADLSRRIGAGARVIVGDGNISSDDRAAWLRAVAKGALQVRSGRVISSREQRRRGKRGGTVMQERSAVHLLRTTHAHKLAMVRAYWTSSEWSTREARAEAINAELVAAGLSPLGSYQTIRQALAKLAKAKR